MKNRKYTFEQFQIASHLFRWSLLIIPVSIIIGFLVALFLWLLDMATQVRWQYNWLILVLPLAGILITALYRYWGKNAGLGNDLLIEEIHQPGGGIPARMAPLILFSTVITHLFGGSAGREGTAVQMGGSISALFGKWYKLQHEEKRILLMGGMAAGFGAVFGTPVTGAIFALEVLAVGRIKYDALIPCLIAGFVANVACLRCGIHHTRYVVNYADSTTSLFSFSSILLVKVIAAGVAFGLASYLFAELSHFIKEKSNQYISSPWLIPLLGGILVIAISYLLGTTDYLGLGVTSPSASGVSIVSAFHAHGAEYFSWFWKLLLTAITLSMGFKGGEVTPLFFIGATLGNTIALLSGAPVDLFAALGFIAVFAGATNTPLACTLLGVELFGAENLVYYAIACFTAYYFSGHSGIYTAQRMAVSKFHTTNTNEPLIKPYRKNQDVI